MIIWSLSAILFYFLHDRAQGHYLLEIAGSFTLVIPLLFGVCSRYSPVAVMSINVMILIAILLWHGVMTDPIGPSLRNKWKADRSVAEVIARNTNKQDKVLLFTNPVLYYLADRLPASRFPFFVGTWKTPLMMPEYKQATEDGLMAETTKIVILHDKSLKTMPEWLRGLVMEELETRFRPLAFESEDIFFGMTTIYVRVEPIASLSPFSVHQESRSLARIIKPNTLGVRKFGDILRL
jgi:hypothetical protein